ncbi:neprilysin-1-like [Dermacentor albipictus]|uniref:neprilysin-1-like n=1 Tax=Dermacentor albipictus TaxID=60249 RepID=UPI0031FD8198
MTSSLWSSIVLLGFARVAVTDYSAEEWSLREATQKHYVCRTKVCRHKANQIRKTLSRTVEPCDDFYEYVCSGWKKANRIPSDRFTYGTFKEVDEKLTKDLRAILGKIPRRGGFKQTVTDKLGIAYKSCVANDRPGRRSLEEFRAILAEMGFAEWPLVGEQKRKPFDDYKTVLLTTRMTPLFNFYVARDMKDLSRNIIRLDQISFSLIGRNELIQPKNETYRKSVRAYKALIRTALRLINPKLKAGTVNVLTEEIFAFESELAKRTASKEERRNMLKMYKRKTIRELEKTFAGLPLLELLNKEFSLVNITLNKDEPVAIMAMSYFASTTNFLKRANTRALFNYMGWRAVLTKASHVSQRFRDAKLDFNRAALGQEKEPPLWKTCVKLTSSLMKEVVGRLYVIKRFSARSKQNVEKLVASMKSTFQKRLKSIKWMDKGTKRRAEHKLKKMTPKIGYPKWILDTGFLEHLYRHLDRLEHHEPFVRILEKISENNIKNSLLELRLPFNQTLRWYTGPAFVNAFYSPDKNEMIFPAGILQGVFYQEGLPVSLNLGAIGTVIGHEMTHGFDDRGSQFDGDGRLHRWWSKQTRKRFVNKANCFVRQYGSIFDPAAKMLLNGKNTLGENIADNGAVRLAYKTYEYLLKTSKTHDVRLPGLEKFSGEQLFFIANAMVWCGKSHKEALQQQIQYDAHSPKMYRVNVPLRNFGAFSRAFKCNRTSAMHPRSTCVLW